MFMFMCPYVHADLPTHIHTQGRGSRSTVKVFTNKIAINKSMKNSSLLQPLQTRTVAFYSIRFVFDMPMLSSGCQEKQGTVFSIPTLE